MSQKRLHARMGSGSTWAVQEKAVGQRGSGVGSAYIRFFCYFVDCFWEGVNKGRRGIGGSGHLGAAERDWMVCGE